MSVSMKPITVLIPVHNAERTLAETLDTLVAQTYKHFEVLIVDDASHDRSAEIALSYQDRLDLRVHTLEKNAGVAGALNAGLAVNTSPYIARIDGDDLMAPTRLEKQFDFLEANPRIDVCSSWMEMFYEDGRPDFLLAKPPEDAAIKTALVQYCSMTHGASLFRKSFFDDIGVFDTRLDFAEDYDLWCRGALLGKCYANLPEPLTRYRQHGGQVGQTKRQLQYERDMVIKRKYISALLDGEPCGHLPEFFSLLTIFTSVEIATTVIQESVPLLFRLSRKVADEGTLAHIVSTSIGRHLRR